MVIFKKFLFQKVRPQIQIEEARSDRVCRQNFQKTKEGKEEQNEESPGNQEG